MEHDLNQVGDLPQVYSIVKHRLHVWTHTAAVGMGQQQFPYLEHLYLHPERRFINQDPALSIDWQLE